MKGYINMNKKVKTLFVTLVVALTCIVPLFSYSGIKANAASASLYLTSTEYKSGTSFKNGNNTYNVTETIYGISLRIKNNPGFASTALKISFTNCSLYKSSSNIWFIDGMISSPTKIYDSSEKTLTLVSGSGSEIEGNGTLYTFFVKKTGTANIKVQALTFADSSGTDITGIAGTSKSIGTTTSNSCKVGDVNGDNAVDSKDATALAVGIKGKYSIDISTSTSSYISTTTMNSSLSSVFPKAKYVEQLDTIVDKKINNDDYKEILEYYADKIAGKQYSGGACGNIIYF